jgi:protein RecA
MSAKIQTDVIPTGCLPLDIALGVGGIPRGRISEIYGNESSGKTTLAYHIIAEAQKAGGTCAFIDAEHALDPSYAAKCGVNVDELLLSQPDYGEQALDIADLLVRSGAIDLFVVDSVAALVPRAELEGEMGDNQVGLQARLMSKALRKLAGSLNKSRCAGIFINQIRSSDLEALRPRKDGKPALMIFNNCKTLIEHIQIVQHDEKNPDDVAKEPHEFTHAPDALRYFCAARNMHAQKTEPKQEYDDTDKLESYEESMTGGEVSRSYISYG